ncbi:MAG: restriction endonuclease subunit S [Thermodesulfovibrionales bacterium]
MLLETSNFYYRFPTEIDSRLDFMHYHPELDVLDDLEKLTEYDVTTISTIMSKPENLVSGKTPKGVLYVDDGIPFLGGTNVRTNETELSETTQIPSIYHTTVLAASQLAKNDILITIAGVGLGTCSIYESEEEANINQAIARLRLVDKSEMNSHFLVRYLNSQFGQFGFVKYSHLVWQPNINLEEIKLLKIIKPSIREQERILEKIKPIEIESKTLKTKATKLQNEALNYLLEELKITVPENPNYFFKTGAEKQTLTFDVFPDEVSGRIHYLFFHPKYKALDELKTNFKTVTLQSICTKPITRGEQPIYEEDGENIVIKTVDIKDRFIDYDSALKVNNEFFNSMKTAKVINGNILLASTGYVSMGKVNVYEREEPAIADGHISIISLNENYDPYFIAYYLRSHLGQIQIEKYFTGSSGQIELQQGDINKFILPSHQSIPKPRQTEIAKAIRKKIEEAIKLEQQAEDKQTEARKLFEKLVLTEIKN